MKRIFIMTDGSAVAGKNSAYDAAASYVIVKDNKPIQQETIVLPDHTNNYAEMYAIYKGNEYEVQRVSKRLKQLELIARKNNRKEDLELGFEDDVYERLTHKLVSRDEIESIRVEKKSVYKEFLEKYTSK